MKSFGMMFAGFMAWTVALSGVAAPIKVVLEAPTEGDREISSYIFGFGTYMREDRNEENTWSLNPAHFRFGGNLAERFNWKVNAWNSGADWYFSNFGSRHKDMIDKFLADNVKAGVSSSVALPMMGWIAKDDSSVSFPVSVYPAQRETRGAAGNGMTMSGKPILADPTRANMAITPAWVEEWVKHLKERFGSFPRHFIVGNEPMLWHRTHRDVHPEPATYDEVLSKYVATAQAVRRADPEAVIIGPALWGWLATQQSAFDERGEWSQWRKFSDRDRHGGKPFLEWFLAEVAKKEKELKTSLLDVVDVHYYPEGEKVRNRNPATDESRRARLEATRSLWDPVYKDDSWINERIRMLPMLKELAKKSKPGLKVAIGEYRFGADEDVSGGVVQAEVLGIFAREGIWSANYWTIPPKGSPVAQAFKLYRNYDGKGATFGERWLGNNIEIQDEQSVFSSYSPKRGVITVLLSNKSLWQPRAFEIEMKGQKTFVGKARAFRFSVGDLHSVVPVEVEAAKGARFELPPLSLLMVELKPEKGIR